MNERPGPKVIVITGASSGFGAAAAERLALGNHRVYGLSVDAVRPALAHGGRLRHLRVDIRHEAEVRRAIRAILRREKRIDVLVNNAGLGVAGAVDETTTEEARNLFDVNFWGLHRLCRQVVPQMRRQGHGTIINVGSLAGFQAIPFQGFYSASKFAVEGISEALSMELKPFGIRVCVVEPGDAATSFVRNRVYARQSRRSAYGARFRSVMRTVERDEENGLDPDVVGRCIARIAERGPRRFRYMVGDPLQRAAVRVKHLVPHALFEGGALILFGAGRAPRRLAG
ncbi:MAG TPA: SDR family NAD(P)-dependent oxidoreductase [Spirochaetia bacterium]|nr:SDR family NAD(P)-dependent oxidoreductase [Spirochaetia bacterium]HTZ53402.1 SDR family NAD(P)-dependent oxidoreductase [Spirochaetia bacterium]